MRTMGVRLRSGGRLMWTTGMAWVAMAVLWTTSWSQSLTWLGSLGETWIEARGVSADGSVVVGYATDAYGQYRAFRWTAQSGMRSLNMPSGFWWIKAYGVSADGSVVVGVAKYSSYQYRAFRWTAADGMEDLGDLGGDYSVAYGVSADGSVVVGVATNARGEYRAFRWTVQSGMQDLGTLFGQNAYFAYGVSADGSVVVGVAVYNPPERPPDYFRAFRWTAQSGMQDLNQLYAALLQGGSELWEARAISPDGRYIVGVGNRGAFLLDTWRRGDTNGDGCIDDSDLLAVLFAFGTPGTGQTRHEDINKDGIVDDADLLTVLSNFGQGC